MATTLSPIRIDTVPSRFVSASAARLFLAGWLSKLHFTEAEDGHLYYSIASESEPGRCYTIDHDLLAQTLTCSCKAGQHGVPCKHVRLLQLSRGWAVEAAS